MFVVCVDLLKRVLMVFVRSSEDVEMFVCLCDLLKRVLRCLCVCADLLKSVEMFVCLSSEESVDVCVFV